MRANYEYLWNYLKKTLDDIAFEGNIDVFDLARYMEELEREESV